MRCASAASSKPARRWSVLGASGGTGLAAIEIGKIMGARVIACASSDEKLEFARAHGADETVNYATEDLRNALKRLGGEHGIDVVYDPVGGALCGAARALARLGRPLSGDRICRRRNSESCRSISCCSRAAISAACCGARGSRREPQASAR